MIRFEPAKPATQKPTHCFRSTADRIADDMAETMREMAFAGEPVSADALISRGYPDVVVQRFKDRAVRAARRRSLRIVEQY